MYRFVLLFFAFAFLWPSPLAAQAMQPVDPQIAWFESFFNSHTDQQVKNAKSKLVQAISENNKRAEAMARKELGLTQLTTTHAYDSAMDYFIRALVIEDSLLLKSEQVFTYISIATVFEYTYDYHQSARALQEALLLSEDSGNAEILVFILKKLGKMNATRANYDTAFQNFERMLEYKDELSHVEAEALFHQAHILTKQDKHKEALKLHKQALTLFRKDQDKAMEAQSLNDIAALYRLMKNETRVLANHQVALAIRKEIGDKPGIAQSHNNIGIHFYEQRLYDSAIIHFQAALAPAHEEQLADQRSISYDFLAQCYKAIGDFETALKYKDDYVAINEMSQGERNDRQVFASQNRYEVGKKQTKIDELETVRKQREQQLAFAKKVRNFLVLVIALALIVVALIINQYVQKKRSNKILEAAHNKVNKQNIELQELNATKDKFFSIISHDLKGPLNSLTSFSNLLINYYESLSKEEVQMLARDFDKSLKNLFQLLENLLEWSRSQTGNIEFKPEVFDLAILLGENKSLLEAQAHNKQITLVNKAEESLSVSAHKQSINTVVRNLISNAIKFTPEGGCITFGLKRQAGEVIVSIADNGIGMKPEILSKLFRIDTKHTTKGTADEKGTGLGLILCKEFVEKNGGRIWVESEPGKGSVFLFSLPLDAMLTPVQGAPVLATINK
ncbi:MAG TPA: tetratricopeptide repeat-containing sensor histidine kinase [Ohtaekwangia sp.]|nr:tetratricopeptide repeat-containing sensor histidine kinase [Ohtaekwangia sp.]